MSAVSTFHTHSLVSTRTYLAPMVSLEDSQVPRAVCNRFLHSLLARFAKSGDGFEQYFIISQTCQEIEREIKKERERVSQQKREKIKEQLKRETDRI